MMTFPEWIQSHRRSILTLLTAFAVAGVASAFSVPVGLFPQISFPRVEVNLEAGDRPAERMAIEVTRPVEEGVRAIPGIRNVRSTTSRGSAEISVNFRWGEDMIAAMLQVESAINRVRELMPLGTTVHVRRMDTTVFPILGYSLTSVQRSLVALQDLARHEIRPMLTTIPGVAQIGVLGGMTAEYQVMVDPAKLDSFGISLTDVGRALSATNVVTAVGRFEDHAKLYLAVVDTQFHNFQEIGRTIVHAGPNGLVLLDDVATVSEGTRPEWTRVTADGRDAVLVQVYQQPDGNTVEIAKQVAARMRELQSRLPPDVRIANWYDQSELILSSASTVRDAVLIGVVLASAILLIFLQNRRVTLIAVLTVPMVLAVTALLLFLLGMTFNIMTLGGMAAAVGLIIDDAIVMIEHVVRRLRDSPGASRDRILAAAREFTPPLVGSSVSTMIIFAPLAFLSGITGAFFKALSLTMAASLAISLLVAWLVVPLLAWHLLKPEDGDQEDSGPWLERIHRGYARLMKRCLSHPSLLVPIAVLLLGGGWLSFRMIGTGFMPVVDEGGFVLDYLAPPASSLTETDRLLRQVEVMLQQTPEVQTYSRRTGLQLGGGLTEANNGDFFVRLTPLPRRSINEVMDELRERIEQNVPGLQIEMAQLMGDLIGDLTAGPEPIEIQLFSDDGELLRTVAPKVAEGIQSVPGVVDINDGIVLAGDALEVHVEREKAALEGIAPETVTVGLTEFLTGAVTSQVQQGPKMVGVRVWVPETDRGTARDISALRLRALDGHLFPVKRVARAEVITGQPQIMREDLKRMVPVTARISGRDMGSTVRDVTAVLDRPGFLPDGLYYRLGGLYQEQQSAFRGLLAVIAAAVALVFILLLFLYESLRIGAILLTIPLLSLAAVFVGLWVTSTELNIS
ncbi:MAG: efflux RND transporter permease subunit, partial [Nitrospirota bacterium]|nr:efflux RND transporter permease subunit [Nitrospirota bacterium]